MARILIVEDDAPVRQIIRMHLELVGHTVFEAEDAASARMLLGGGRLQLAVLDIMLPGEDGFSLARSFLEAQIPVLFVTARTSVADRVRGLQMGAQDYILKPFEPAELLARVENILRRTHAQDTRLVCGALEIDFEARRVFRDGAEVMLTTMEFDLLAMLARRRNVAMSREELLIGVWGYDYTGETRTVDVHIQRLRSKIGAELIDTVYKYGYRLSVSETAG